MQAKARPRQELHRLIDDLPETETHAARRFLEYLRDRSLPGSLLQAEAEEEELSVEGVRLLEEGIEDGRAGRTVSGDEVRGELGW